MDRSTARALAYELIDDVETQALPPRVPQAYEEAKARFMALVERPAATESRAGVYAAARAMLATLDTDGHTQLWSKQWMSAWQGATRPEAAGAASAVRTVEGPGRRQVLVLRPPQTTFTDNASTRAYALKMIDGIHRRIRADDPCAVVVDLGDQQGGNAWPAMAALAPLVTAANDARFVDRDGARQPVVPAGIFAKVAGGPLPVSDLARFSGRPFAIVLTPRTVSAGEMVAIALHGEPGARSFGRPTYGATTANKIVPLPDEASVLLTAWRYAFGDAAPLRGPVLPDVPASPGDTPQAILAQAVAWAAGTCGRGANGPE